MSLTDAVTEQIVATLDAVAQQKRDEEARARELEGQGYRIVNDGSSPRVGGGWQYTDWRTGEVLAKGRSSKSFYKFEPPDNWYHTDHVYEETSVGPKLVDGLPESLAHAVIEWTWEHQEEARRWTSRHR